MCKSWTHGSMQVELYEKPYLGMNVSVRLFLIKQLTNRMVSRIPSYSWIGYT